MSKVAFISIMWHTRFVEELGVEYLSAILHRETKHEVKIFYKFPEEDYDEFFEKVIAFGPNIIGFSLSHKYTGLEPLYAGAALLKKRLNNVCISIGGIFASTNAENILNKIKEVDCVFLGESEIVISDFVNKIANNQDFSDIDGIAYRDRSGKVIANPKTKFIMNLDNIPFPDRPYLNEDWFKKRPFKMVNMIGSRGCHGHCHFCNVPTMYAAYGEEHRWRGRSVNNILDEMETLYKSFGVLIFSFNDSSFEDCIPMQDGKKRLEEFAKGIINRGMHILWTCCFRAETFKNNEKDLALVDLLVRSGLYNILIGVEAGNKRALNDFSKRATVEDNYDAISIFEKYPLYISKGFIMFTPQSTPELLDANLEFAHKIGLDQELIYLTTKAAVFDKTPYVIDLQESGYLDSDYDWENEYPYNWKNKNVEKFADALQFIRDVYMDQLEYTQYYGRNAIIWERFANGNFINELGYNKYHVIRLRKEIGVYNYMFIKECINLCKKGWNIHEYRIIKSKYFDHGFLKVYDEMVLQSKKISRLLRMHNITMDDIAQSRLLKGEDVIL